MAQKITDNIFWIGVDNPESRDFHGISTPRGGSYNSYLIIDEQLTIVDATNKPFFKDYIDSLKTVIDPKDIKNIVINHAEPDHTGALKELLDECPDARIICTEKCKDFLQAQYSIGAEFKIVNSDDTLSIGKKTLRFFPIPMIHWPETMVTFLEDEKALFSGDLFGTEIGHESLFAKGMEDFSQLTKDYFAIVFRPFAAQVKKGVELTKKLDPSMILPSHGPVYKEDKEKIIGSYERLATQPEENKVLIVYYSIWHSTQKMANEIAKGAIEAGSDVVMYDIADANLVRLMSEALTCKAIALGSLTIANTYHPSFDSLFTFLKLNNQKNKKTAVFGTYGWSSAAVSKLKQKLQELEYDVIGELDFRFGPKTPEDQSMIRELGRRLAEVK